MSKRMMAVVVHAGDEFAYEEVERPVADQGEIILKIEAAGICAADRKIYSKNHPWQLPDPYFPGHEYVGRVVEMGEGAAERTGLRVGDRAIAEILIPCRECWFCQRGLYTHCDRPGCVSVHGPNICVSRPEPSSTRFRTSCYRSKEFSSSPLPARCTPPTWPGSVSPTWWLSLAWVRSAWVSCRWPG